MIKGQRRKRRGEGRGGGGVMGPMAVEHILGETYKFNVMGIMES